MTQVYVAYAHPIGEDGDIFWMAAGTTQEKAMDRLVAKVVESWYAYDETPDPAKVRAEIEDPQQWVVLWDEDTLE